MDWLKNVVKVEDNTSKPHNIRGIFSQCGEIPLLHPFDTGNVGDAHYFLQFQTARCAQRALHLKPENQVPGIHVYSVHQTPYLIDQYRGANPSAFDSLPSSSSTTAQKETLKLSDHASDYAFSKQKKSYIALPLIDRLDPAGKAPGPSHARKKNLLPPSPHKPSSQKSTSKLIKGKIQIADAFKQNLMSPALKDPASSLSQPPPMGFNPTSLQVIPPDSAPPTSMLSFSIETHITLNLHGQAIVYDLRSLEPEPRGAIELLKLTHSERGAWMTIGAYYRRIGNASAAIAVTNAMLEVMAREGIPEAKLKFAYLLLSGCEADLARTTKLENKDLSEKHTQNAQEWLQKVYPVSDDQLQLRWSQHMASFVSIPNSETQVPSQALKREASVQTKLLSSPVSNRVLEREIQSLRDRFVDQAVQLSEIHTAKRKLMDDNSYERDLRRKLQKHLEDTQKERDSARKMEDFALQQVKREVASRRKAEESAEREHQMRLELLQIAEKKIGREPLSEVLQVAHVSRKFALVDENVQP